MSPRISRLLPSPAVALGLAAFVMSATGLAVAAIPDSKGVIHSCYAKSDGALRVVSGKKCQAGEKKLSWNKQGAPGKAGATNVKIRRGSVVMHYPPCAYIATNVYDCNAPGNDGTAPCNGGERATGGGYAQPSDGVSVTISESKPSPTSGTPTGWTVATFSTSTSSTSSTHADTVVPIYAVCAAP